MATLAPRDHGRFQHWGALILFLVLALGGLYLIYAYDVFYDESYDTVHELKIELDEALLYGASMTLLLMGYAARLFQLRRRQERTQREAMAEARRAGDSDALTGLANRRRFDTALAEMLATSAGPGRDAVMLIDLDGFKQVNDTFGHGAGDAVLTAVGQRVVAAVREHDLVARIGGDEFAILAPAVGSAAAAQTIAARVAASIAQPIRVDEQLHQVGCSIGIQLAPVADAGARDVVAGADAAMYAAKRAGAAIRFHPA